MHIVDLSPYKPEKKRSLIDVSSGIRLFHCVAMAAG